MRSCTRGSIGTGLPGCRTPRAICSSSAATGIGDAFATESRSRCSNRGRPYRTVVRAGVGAAVGRALGSRADRGDAGERFRLVAGRGRRGDGRVEEHRADPCRAWDGEVADGDGGDGMTIDDQLRDIARHIDEHQPVITAAEIVQRVSGQRLDRSSLDDASGPSPSHDRSAAGRCGIQTNGGDAHVRSPSRQ